MMREEELEAGMEVELTGAGVGVGTESEFVVVNGL